MRLFLPSVMKTLGLNTRVVNLFNFLYFLYNFQRVFVRTIYLSNVFQYLSFSIHLKFHVYYEISFSENCLLSQKYMFRVWHFRWMLFWEYSFSEPRFSYIVLSYRKKLYTFFFWGLLKNLSLNTDLMRKFQKLSFLFHVFCFN